MRRSTSLLVLCAATLLGLCAASSGATGIDQVEHIVIWMQENRAFDHYYGTLAGVRGFNDRAAPPLPSGKTPFYQPAMKPGNDTGLCGCMGCDIKWTAAGLAFKGMIESMSCSALHGDMLGANPPVNITQGELCSVLLKKLSGTSFDGFKFSDFFDEAESTCPSTLKVTGLPVGPPKINGYMLPFNLQFSNTAAQCMPAPEMAYVSDIGIFDDGLMDAWNTARAPGFGMAFFNRTDLPYYYALADAFLVGDAYHQSTFTATNPNRLHLFSGSNGLSVNSTYDVLDDAEPAAGFGWETMGETLEKAGISWQVLQQEDNFDDNAFAWFTNYKAAKPGQPLWDKGMARVTDIVDTFSQMVANDSLPQVMWIVGPTALSEHATNHPASGEDLSHRLIDVLADPANADVYAKTAFILNYDEGGQFFDHVWTPVPPRNAADGASTVTTEGEITKEERLGVAAGHPIGLGFRVPLFLISPWTRGAYTFSETSDHTSVIKFIEKRFGVHCPNISPWRRAVTGDLTHAFDWDHPDYSWPSSFPSTAGNVNSSEWQCEHNPPPKVPTVQSMPAQEPGTRMARALPYEFGVTDKVAGGAVSITIANTGTQAAVFFAFNTLTPSVAPQKYTIEAGKSLTGSFKLTMAGSYSVRVYGPNGFIRTVAGKAAAAFAGAHLAFRPADGEVAVLASLDAAAPSCTFHVVDNAYGAGPWSFGADPGMGEIILPVDTSAQGNWYDLTVTVSEECGGAAAFTRQFMGHMENGKDTITDPAMGRTPTAEELAAERHPEVPAEYIEAIQPWDSKQHCQSARSRLKDACWGKGASEGAMKPRYDSEL